VLAWSAGVAGGDAHAGRTETSLMLAIDAGAVRMALAAPGPTEPVAALLPRLSAEGVRPISSNGVLGDPAGANAEEGATLLSGLIADLVSAVDARWPQR
jgi:creatinine amidohydrolase